MSAFKDMVAADCGNVFINPDEFAETHNLNGKPCVCIVQNITSDYDMTSGDTLARNYYELYGVHKEVNVVKEALTETPVYGQKFYLDEELYSVMEVADDMGILTIVLVANNR